MHRTQILLERRQYEMLKAISEREGRSLASLVREAVGAFLRGRATAPATTLGDLAGIGADSEAGGRHHDEILYGRRDKRD